MIAILGQGIAGTALALRLLEKGIDFVVFDDGYKSSSSMVAAGLWNPIVFRRINKSWMADEFISELESFYPRMESLLEVNFYKPRPVWRIHGSKQERDKWFEKNDLPGFIPYLFNPPPKLEELFGRIPEFGEGEVRHAGYLDIPVFLTASRRYIAEKGCFQDVSLSISPSIKELKDALDRPVDFTKVIDCRGNRSSMSDWWSYLPFGLTKGEVLTLKCPGLKLEQTFNAGFFVLPLGNELYRVGATFSWKDKTPDPTEAGKKELLDKFETYFTCAYEIIDHKAGIRPTVQDRRPLIGEHPKEENLYLFNGLGTKGVMLAPFLSAHFVDFLFGDVTLSSEINIERFEKHWGEKNPTINYPYP
ncbi:FAD-dependent oxidoreductase [Cryomorphaceae bacterium 1068]|nr:FAD-dependent oxidoreductase [Cryomorphaceae bacterium 1068]